MSATAFKRLSLYGLLAVAPVVVEAQMPPQWVAERMVKRLSDSDLGCAWLRQQIREAMLRTNGSNVADIGA